MANYTLAQVEAVLAGSDRLNELQARIKQFVKMFKSIVRAYTHEQQVRQKGEILVSNDPGYPRFISWRIDHNEFGVYLDEHTRDERIRISSSLETASLPQKEVVGVYRALPRLVDDVTRRLDTAAPSVVKLGEMVRNMLAFYEDVAAEEL